MQQLDGDLISYNPIEDELKKELDAKIHLHVKKRTARKYITTIEGLVNRGIDPNKFITTIRKKLCCNGSVVKNKSGEEVIQLQGDHRDDLTKVLQEKFQVKDYDIIKHGF